jgi:hypothetical protein
MTMDSNLTDTASAATESDILAAIVETPETDDERKTREPDAEETDAAEGDEGAERDEADDADDAQGSGAEDGTAEDEGDDQAPKRTFRVKVDGKEIEVSEAELIRGYAGQAYIQKGMQEVAQARQATAEAYQALMAERNALAAALQAVQSGVPLQAPQPPAREMIDKDPIGYIEALANYNEQKQKYEAFLATLGQADQAAQQSELTMRAATIKDEMAKLLEAVPELTDKRNAARFRSDVLKIGAEVYGFAPQELTRLVDHRALRVLYDAVRYRKSKTAEKADKPLVAEAPRKVAGPAQRQTTTAEATRRMAQLRERAAKTGDVDDIAAMLVTPVRRR